MLSPARHGRPWTLRTLLGVPALILGLAGCGGNGVTNGARTTVVPHAPSPLKSSAPAQVSPPAAHTAASGPSLGTIQLTRVGGADLSVDIQRVIDPLPPAGVSLPPGDVAVGVHVTLVNRGSGVYDSSATGDFSIVSSAGLASPVFVPSGVCQTPLQDFDNYITDGETRSGCVAFAVPRRARLVAVRFSPHARAAGRLTWRLPG